MWSCWDQMVRRREMKRDCGPIGVHQVLMKVSVCTFHTCGSHSVYTSIRCLFIHVSLSKQRRFSWCIPLRSIILIILTLDQLTTLNPRWISKWLQFPSYLNRVSFISLFMLFHNFCWIAFIVFVTVSVPTCIRPLSGQVLWLSIPPAEKVSHEHVSTQERLAAEGVAQDRIRSAQVRERGIYIRQVGRNVTHVSLKKEGTALHYTRIAVTDAVVPAPFACVLCMRVCTLMCERVHILRSTETLHAPQHNLI